MSAVLGHETIRVMLVQLIGFWRKAQRTKRFPRATCDHYVDAYQTVYRNIFDELVPENAVNAEEE